VIIPNRREPGARATQQTGSGDPNFLRRTASALVLAPLAIAAAVIGGWVFTAATAVTAAVVLWEWSALVAPAMAWRILAPGLPGLLVAAVLVPEGAPITALAILVLAALAAAATIWLRRPDGLPAAPSWAAAGVVYAGVLLWCALVLRGDPEMGRAALLFLFASVWATDIFAYLTGRALGGPLLWPRISPNKTWAGAFGGLAGGIAAGTVVAYASAGTQPLVAGVLALTLSIAAQAGDLLESWVKRQFGAKDASTLIPGHGGVMDRVDGLLLAAMAAVLIGALRFGPAASARGLLLW
jgi:phosphatidate cytidylyltransferase